MAHWCVDMLWFPDKFPCEFSCQSSTFPQLPGRCGSSTWEGGPCISRKVLTRNICCQGATISANPLGVSRQKYQVSSVTLSEVDARQGSHIRPGSNDMAESNIDPVIGGAGSCLWQNAGSISGLASSHTREQGPVIIANRTNPRPRPRRPIRAKTKLRMWEPWIIEKQNCWRHCRGKSTSSPPSGDDRHHGNLRKVREMPHEIFSRGYHL